MAWLMPLSVTISTFGSANGTLFAAGRLCFAASREGHLLDILSYVHVRRYTPAPGLIFHVSTATVFWLGGILEHLLIFHVSTATVFWLATVFWHGGILEHLLIFHGEYLLFHIWYQQLLKADYLTSLSAMFIRATTLERVHCEMLVDENTSLIAVAMVLSGSIDSLIDFFSFTAWIFYGGAMLALIVMRYTKPNAPRPYKVSVPLRGVLSCYSVTQASGLVP
uniref:Uncharacterized protein n=1 Tax=Timema shepardi TaxID=629360 RepID=A0A7R9BCZ9_TIMSH|nr:unnamed protein product [Timema shepardi]